MDVTFVLFK